jgi:hypothetical protein
MDAEEVRIESEEEHRREKAVLAQRLHETEQRLSVCSVENSRLQTTLEEQAVLTQHCQRALQESHELETTMRSAASEWSTQFEIMRGQMALDKEEKKNHEDERQR